MWKISQTGQPAANENLESMVIPIEFHTAFPFSQTHAEVQGNLLREYEQKFAELLEREELTKLCTNAGLSENIQMMMHLTICKDHVESILYLEVRNHPTHEDRPSPGCEGLLSSMTLRCGDQDRIFIS